MFSSIFGKRRSSPVEENTPPIPGPRSEDDFVVVGPPGGGGPLYPNIGGTPYPQRPAPAPPMQRLSRMASSDQSFHYLQGVPLSLSKELQMASKKDSLSVEIGDLLAFVMNKINMNKYDYDFSVERSVLREC